MPRKKKRIVDNVESENDMPSLLQERISAKLSQLPQDFYFLLSQNPEQAAKWMYEKDFFRSVGKVIDAFFTGDAPPTFEEKTKYEEEAIELEVWRFLSFYSMVSANWKKVQQALKKESAPSIPVIGTDKISASIPQCDFSTLQTPGEVLLKAMEYSAVHQMGFYFGGWGEAETDYAQRKVIADVNKSRRADASPLLIRRIEESLRKRQTSNPCSKLENICFFASYDTAKKGRPKQTVKNYIKAGYEREAFEKKWLHPQSKGKGQINSA